MTSVRQYERPLSAPGGETVVVLVPIAPGLNDDPARREAFRDWILGDLLDSTGVDRLYYAGAYANPGVGVPMCLLSGGQAAAAAVRDAI